MMDTSLGSFYAIISSLIFLCYWLLVVSITVRIITRRRTTSYLIAWLLIIYIIPFLGFVFYFLFGEIHLGKARAKRAHQLRGAIAESIHQIYQYPEIFTDKVSDVANPIFKLCKHQTGLEGITGNRIDLLSEAEYVFDQLIMDINNANHSIEMVFYIWDQAGRVEQINAALVQASNRGVSIHIMLDSAGSRQFLGTKACATMRFAGIEIIEVLKVNLLRFFFRRLDLRQHRKMIIIDNDISYTGSMNMVDPCYFKKKRRVGEWIDIMVRMQGPITLLMQVIYANDWALETKTYLDLPHINTFYASHADEEHVLQLVPSGPGYTENMIHQVLLTAIYAAQKQIILTSPYFVPSDDILQALCAAGQRGVDVIIIVPQNNDSMMVKWASRAFYTELLTANINVYEFQVNLLHAKSVLIDEQVSLIGTVNIDMRSLWLNFEITAVIDDHQFAKDLKHVLDGYLNQAKKIELAHWLKRPYWQPIVERLFHLFSPLL